MNFNDEVLKMYIGAKLMKNQGKGIKNKMEDKRGQYNFSTCGKKNHEMEKKNEMKDKEKN